MDDRLYALLVWFGTVSLFTLLLFGWDKLMAKLDRHRIPEAALLAAALLGGGTGGLLGMLLLRHKIRKPLFCVTVPLSFILQGAFLLFFMDLGQIFPIFR